MTEAAKPNGISKHSSNLNAVKKEKEKKINRIPFFYKFAKFHKNPIFNLMLNDRLRRLVLISSFSSSKESVALDIGCGGGHLTNYYANQFEGLIIGIDVSKDNLYISKFMKRFNTDKSAETTFVLADINYLPFRNSSLDFVVCASVLEHVQNLKGAIREIEDSLKVSANFVAGYPIETNTFLALVKLFASDWMSIRDPRILGRQLFEENPDTHKQSFKSIRRELERNFLTIQRDKAFISIFPDSLSWYECVRLAKK